MVALVDSGAVILTNPGEVVLMDLGAEQNRVLSRARVSQGDFRFGS